ncbi:MAG: phosphatidate cytidylyltransferase [Chloroflexi bacterium]|nr:phosphatidate cytidylyltransferase [Chloroflexota bacterium]
MLSQRITSAAVALALLLAALFFGGTWGWAIFVSLAGILAAVEFCGLGTKIGYRPLTTLACAWSASLVLSSAAFPGHGEAAIGILSAGTVISFIFLLVRPEKKDALGAFGWTLATVLYIGWLSRYLVELRAIESGRDWLLITLLTVFAVDTSAYFIGKKWGKHRMAPAVSPGKTKEGAAAGLAGGLAVSLLMSTVLDLPLSLLHAGVLGLLIGIFAQLGDLTESLFKRSAGVKDSGRLMPGHGGILDRTDSILLAGTVVYYYVSYAVR